MTVVVVVELLSHETTCDLYIHARCAIIWVNKVSLFGLIPSNIIHSSLLEIWARQRQRCCDFHRENSSLRHGKLLVCYFCWFARFRLCLEYIFIVTVLYEIHANYTIVVDCRQFHDRIGKLGRRVKCKFDLDVQLWTRGWLWKLHHTIANPITAEWISLQSISRCCFRYSSQIHNMNR